MPAQKEFSPAMPGESRWTPFFNRLLAARGLEDPARAALFLSPSLEQLLDPFGMKSMKESCARIQKALRQKEKIFVHGDYDVDGVTAAALVSETLNILKANHRVFLPDRAVDGYGVSQNAVLQAAREGFRLLITVDCGITAHGVIRAAREAGMDVIVIDHHHVPEAGLPDTEFILNPQRADCSYPFKELSAAGLAFKLSQALLGAESVKFLDLAALSTICDVAPLAGENRVIVKKGLEILSTRSRLGLKSMIELSGLKARQIGAGHVGFMIGPRINAAGRMSSPEIAMRLLITENVKEAESLAAILEEENKSRQREEKQVLKEAIAQVERIVNFSRDRVIVVASDGWHQGVIGIVAARLVEKYHRPSFVIALEEGKGKGSARSIKGFHLLRALEASAQALEQFGGHELAAGLTIKKEKVQEFRAKINEHAMAGYPPQAFERRPSFDLEVQLADFGNVFLKELELLEPHGAGNPRPSFLTRGLEIKNKPERRGEETLVFWVTDGQMTYEAVWYERAGAPPFSIERGNKVDLVYQVKVKSWQGVESLSLEVKGSLLPGSSS